MHVASDMSNSNDPDVVVGNAVKGVLNALRAAKKEGAGMKRFVYTWSSTAATLPKPGKVLVLLLSPGTTRLSRWLGRQMPSRRMPSLYMLLATLEHGIGEGGLEVGEGE